MTSAAEWQGRVGATWASHWQRTDRAFAGIAATLDAAVSSAAPVTGTALDIGCGAGSTAFALQAARPQLAVTGCDLSAELVAVARERAAYLSAAERPRFVHADACEVARRLAPLDLLASRHGVMFFDHPVDALAALNRAAAPGAPLVFSCFRDRARNGWAAEVDAALGLIRPPDGTAPGPYAFADHDHVARLLAAAGWRDATASAHVMPFRVGDGDDPVADALAFYRRIGSAAALLADATPEARLDMEARLADMLVRHVRDGVVTFDAAIWIWTARAGDVP